VLGKTPLHKALGRFYPELNGRLHKTGAFQQPLAASRRDRRKGLSPSARRAQIDELRSDNRYAVLEVRADLQALDIPELESLLQQGDVLFEGSSFVGRALQTNSRLASVNRLSHFHLAAFQRRDRLSESSRAETSPCPTCSRT